MISRRRLLIAAAATGCTGLVPREQRTEWRGKALGALASISVVGQGARARDALRAAHDTVIRIERYFSLFDVNSRLSELNATGQISMPPEFSRLVALTQQVHLDTDGLFDPTIQPLFRLYATSPTPPSRSELRQVRRAVGWDKVKMEGQKLQLTEPAMALTFNGIAQGFATDRVCEVLSAHGYDRYVVNLGEHRSGNNRMRLATKNLEGDTLAELEIRGAAVATSSSHGYAFASGDGHILHPAANRRTPVRWKTSSVIAPTAALADAYATSLILTKDLELAQQLKLSGKIQVAVLQDVRGHIFRI